MDNELLTVTKCQQLLKWLSGQEPPANLGDTGGVDSVPGSEDPLEEGMATTPVFLPGESHGQSEPGGLQSMGLESQHARAAATILSYLAIQCWGRGERKRDS